MNKKGVNLFVLLSILILGVIYGYALSSDELLTTPIAHVQTSQSDNFTVGTALSVSNYSKSDEVVLLNLTFTFGSADPTLGNMNITSINLEQPNNTVLDNSNSSWGIYGYDSAGVVRAKVSDWDCNTTAGQFPNGSYVPIFNWTCTNSTDSVIGPGDTIALWFNHTTNSTTEELAIYWDVLITATNETYSNHSFTTAVDGGYPDVLELNITDGNTTLMTNRSSNDRAIMSNFSLDGTSALTVTISVTDATLEPAAYLYWVQSATGTNATLSTTNISRVSVSTAEASTIDIPSTGTYKYTFTIPAATDATDSLLSFIIAFNDTFNHLQEVNNSLLLAEPGFGDDAQNQSSFLVNLTSDVLRFDVLNVTDQRDGENNTLTNGGALTGGGNDYLRAEAVTFNIELSGPDKLPAIAYDPSDVNNTGVVIAYNRTTTGANTMVHRENGEITNTEAVITMDNLTVVTASSNGKVLYEASLDLTGNDTNRFEFWVVANNTNNYTVVSGPHSFKIDGSAPNEPTMTAPTSRSIEASSSITYSCSSEDGGSGVAQYDWVLTKPNSDTVTKTNGGASVTFTGTDTNQAGTYTIKCTAIDGVGYSVAHTSVTSTEDFVVYLGTGTSGSEGAGGGGAGAATPAFDVDLSQADVTEASTSGRQGTIKSFSFDGTTKHTITFRTVTESSVVLVIKSDPVELALKVGESKKADLNADGINDLEVKLDAIANGVAEITAKKLERGATKLVEEEAAKQPAGVTPTQPTAPTAGSAEAAEEGGISTTATVIVVLLILAIIAVGYYFIKQKK
jgi:hypothetical protein